MGWIWNMSNNMIWWCQDEYNNINGEKSIEFSLYVGKSKYLKGECEESVILKNCVSHSQTKLGFSIPLQAVNHFLLLPISSFAFVTLLFGPPPAATTKHRKKKINSIKVSLVYLKLFYFLFFFLYMCLTNVN